MPPSGCSCRFSKISAKDGPSGASQLEIRPSALVRALKAAEGPNGLRRVRATERPGAGTPLTRSRTWQVMGSFGLLVVAAGRNEEGSLGWGSNWLRFSMLRFTVE